MGRFAGVGDWVDKGNRGYDVRAYGAVGDGATDDRAAINSAATAAAGKTLYFPSGTYKISSDITIGSTVCCRFEKGASLSIDSSKTVTINGKVEAGLYQIFAGSGTILLATTSAYHMLPEWFGCVADGVTDNATALTRLYNSITGGTFVHINFSHGIYCFSAFPQWKKTNTVFRGQGCGTELSDSTGQTILRYTGAASTTAINIGVDTATNEVRFEKMTIAIDDKTKASTVGVYFQYAHIGAGMRDVHIYGFKTGIKISQSFSQQYDRVRIWYADICVHLSSQGPDAQVNDIKFNHCDFVTNADGTHIYAEIGTLVVFTGCSIQSGKYGLHSIGGIASFLFYGCYFEFSQSDAFVFKFDTATSYSMFVIGNYMFGNSGAVGVLSAADSCLSGGLFQNNHITGFTGTLFQTGNNTIDIYGIDHTYVSSLTNVLNFSNNAGNMELGKSLIARKGLVVGDDTLTPAQSRILVKGTNAQISITNTTANSGVDGLEIIGKKNDTTIKFGASPRFRFQNLSTTAGNYLGIDNYDANNSVNSGIRFINTDHNAHGEFAILTRNYATIHATRIDQYGNLILEGKLGISTTGVSRHLTVKGSTHIASNLSVLGKLLLGTTGGTKPVTIKGTVGITGDIVLTGRLGIGTTPSGYNYLDIGANIPTQIGFRIRNAANGANAQIQNQLENNIGALAYYGITASNGLTSYIIGNGRAFFGAYLADAVFFTQSNNDLIFAAGGIAAANEWMRIKANGNIGIGTTGSSRKLTIKGSSYVVSNFAIAGKLFVGTTGGTKPNVIKSTTAFGNVVEFGTTAVFDIVYDNGNSGTSKTIDWNLGNKQKITTTGSCTLTFTAPAGPCSLQLEIIHENSATAYVYTYPATVKWAGGTKLVTTNTANAVDIVSFFYDGTNYYSMGNAFS